MFLRISDATLLNVTNVKKITKTIYPSTFGIEFWSDGDMVFFYYNVVFETESARDRAFNEYEEKLSVYTNNRITDS